MLLPSTALASFLLASPPATDVASRLVVEWDAPPGCPTEADVRGRIGAYLGRDEFDAVIDEVRIQARVRRTTKGDAWLLHVEISSPQESTTRQIEAPRCEDVRDAAALIIGVALDPLRLSRNTPPPPSTVATAPEVLAVPEAPPRTLRAWTMDARAGGVLEIGTTPRVAGGIAVELAAVGPWVRFGLVSRYLPPRTFRPFAPNTDAGITVQIGTVGLRGCLVPRVGPIELPSCAQVDTSVVRGQGVGLQTARVAHRAWVTVSLGQELVWHGRRGIGVWVAADAVATVYAPRFVIDDLGPVFSPGWASFRLLAGPAMRF